MQENSHFFRVGSVVIAGSSEPVFLRSSVPDRPSSAAPFWEWEMYPAQAVYSIEQSLRVPNAGA